MPRQSAAWVSLKGRAPQPRQVETSSVEVSRSSGLVSSTGTFGTSTRFPEKLKGKGVDSPGDENYYREVRLYKKKDEMGFAMSQGVGDRPSRVLRGPPPTVGPGSYDSVGSVTRQRSPLDGPDYCTTTMKEKLGSSLVPAGARSPGPHASYTVRGEPDAMFPTYAAPRLKHGGRRAAFEDRDGPGYDYNSHNLKSESSWMSCPNLKGGESSVLDMATGGSKRFIKSTFGTSERFKDGKGTATPKGSMYYAHSKFLSSEDYMTGAPASSFGYGSKTDFSNPNRTHRNQVSPATYSPHVKIVGSTSPLDGFATRSCSSLAFRGGRSMTSTA